jgi:hypothetical protein
LEVAAGSADRGYSVSVRKVLCWAAGVAATLYLGFLGVLFFSQGSIIYPGATRHQSEIGRDSVMIIFHCHGQLYFTQRAVSR